MSLTEQEVVRYSRHIILPEVGGRGQKKLKGASILLAGLGAAGSAAALYLAAAGVGHLTLWDGHLLTAQDLEGGIAHDRSRIGQPRARSAAVALRAINPAAQIDVLEREGDVAGAVAGRHLAVASSGDWQALSAAAAGSGAGLILYGTHGAEGAATALPAGFEVPDLAAARGLGLFPEENSVPAVAAAAGVIGVVAATEAVKLILGVGTPLAGRILRYDGWTARFWEEALR